MFSHRLEILNVTEDSRKFQLNIEFFSVCVLFHVEINNDSDTTLSTNITASEDFIFI